MRKHFLLLFLMALLPLAGWAQDVVTFKVGDLVLELTGDQDNDDAVAAFLTYSATEKALPVPTKIGGDDITQFVVSHTWYRTTTSGNNIVKTGDPISKLEDAGDYICEFTVNQGNHQGDHSGILTINKCMLTVTATDLINDDALHYGDAFSANNVEVEFTGWPAAVTPAQQETLKNAFGTITYDTDYVPFESGVTDMTANPVVYYDVVPIITGLNSSNYDFTAVHGKLQIVAKSFEDATLNITVSNVFYNGGAAAPQLTVKDAANPSVTLVKDTDYELLYFASVADAQAYDPDNNDNDIPAPIHVGNYYFTINGKGNYSDTYGTVQTYKVRPEYLIITMKEPTITYDAQEHELADPDLYEFDGLAAVDAIDDVEIQLQDAIGPQGAMADYKTAGQNPEWITAVTNVAQNQKNTKDAGGYKFKKINPVFTNNSVAEAGDYTVVLGTEYFKINQAEIIITIKEQLMHEDEAETIKGDGIAIVLDGNNANVDTYLRVSDVKKPLGNDAITAYPNIKATQDNTGAWNIGFKNNGKPTVKLNNNTVTDNYTFTINPGVLTIIADLGTLYVIPQSDTYGSLTKEGYIKVKVVGGTTEANAALETLLNNDKVKPAFDDDEDSDTYGETLPGVSLDDPNDDVEYPNAGIYVVAYDEAVQETAEWQALAAEYDINTTGRNTYTINKRALTITLKNQSLNEDDDVDDLVANKYTVKINNLATGEAEKNFYAAVAGNFEFAGHVTDDDGGDQDPQPLYLDGGALNADAVAYADERVNETDENTTPGYFANAISLNVAGLLAEDAFANYTFTADDITKGGLFVSDKDVDFVLNLNYASKAAWDEAITADQTLETHNADEIELNNNHKVATVGFDAFEMKAEKWYPMVLPFNTSVAELSEKFGYAVVNILNKENTDDAIRFKLHMQDIEANQPFLIKIYEDKVLDDANAPVEFTNKTIFDEDYSEDVNENTGIKFVGFYDAKIGVTAHDFWFSHVPGYDARYGGKADANRFLRPLNAFVNTPANSIAKVIYVEDPNQGVTAIDEITTKGAEAIAVEGWYTINGMKLEGVPTEKGVYINNGKKIVIK